MSIPISTAFFSVIYWSDALLSLKIIRGYPVRVSRTYESYKYYCCFRFAPVNSVLKKFHNIFFGNTLLYI